MVLVLSCHPFVSKKVINPSKEPIRCLISGNWVLVFTVGHVTEIYQLVGGECCLQSSVKNKGVVKQAVFCHKGYFLVTLEKVPSDTVVHIYYSFRESKHYGGTRPGEHTVEVATDVKPSCIACCSLTGNLAVGGDECIQILKLAHQQETTGLKPFFKPYMNIHVSYLNIQLLDMHESFLAVSCKRELHVLYIPGLGEEEAKYSPDRYKDAVDSVLLPSILSEEIYYHRKDEIYELQGPSCIAPRTAVVAHRSVDSDSAAKERVFHLLYKLLKDGETDYHSLQLIPRYHTCTPSTENSSLVTLHCLVSNTKEGYLYQLYPTVELHSRYHYTSPSTSVSVGDDFLFAVTDQGLDTYSHRVHAAFIRELEKTDHRKKACPSPNHDTCLVSMKPFYGLQCLDSSQKNVLMMSKVKGNTSKKQHSDMEDAWSIYILEVASAPDIFDDIIDFGLHSNQMNPELYLQGLLEGHLLLKARIIQNDSPEATDGKLVECYKTSCKLLGEFYARKTSSENLLTLPYFEMAGLTMEEVWRLCYLDQDSGSSNQPNERTISRGLLHYFEFSVFCKEMCKDVSQECLSSILEIFLEKEPVLCSEVIVAPHLQDKVDFEKADQILKDLKKKVMHGQNYHWSTLDFIAVINVYLRKGEMEQAMATFDLIYEDELVSLCSEREDLIIQNDKEQFTDLGGMMCRFPSAIVAILINMTESGHAEYLQICKIIEKNTKAGSGRDVILVEYLEAFVNSSAEPCLALHAVAVEKLLLLYIDCLLSESSSQTTKTKKNTSTRNIQKRNRLHWLNGLPPFEGSDVTVCHRISQPVGMLGQNTDLSWRFNRGSSPKPNQITDRDCHCLDCHKTLVKLQEMLSKQRNKCMNIHERLGQSHQMQSHQDINIHKVLEECRQLPDQKGRFSLEILCLAVSSMKEAVEVMYGRDPSLAVQFCLSMVSLEDADMWRYIIGYAQKLQAQAQGRHIKVYQDCLKDILDHLATNLRPQNFQRIVSHTEVGPEIVRTFTKKAQREEKVRHLKEDIISSLAALVKS